ncbi:MAG: cysteine--tRNA ligase [Pseudomonadota bacterium]
MLKLYDTMAREKRPFVPADPERVTMYVCGPTVYGYAHIGNFRPVVVFDTLFRLLRHVFGAEHVVYARNVTDVDDKINAKAAEEGVDIRVISDRYLAAYEADAGAMGALQPTLSPRATAHIAAMQAQIDALLQRGAAYAAEGHVLFDTQSFADYGRLSGRPLDEMIAGARVEVAPYKRHPADFVLWKPSKPGEPVWDSPWGPGRPGWHIECSAMIEATLGLPIDIHGGGIDLTFPHHENELAQGRCAHDLPTYARFWMHNGFLDIEGVKMSKSLGNVVIPHDLLTRVPGEVVRWALLSGHYRQPLDWTGELLEQSRKNLDYLYGVLQRVKGLEVPATAAPAAVVEALADDLNTPRAYAELFALAKALETAHGEAKSAAKAALLAASNLMGFLEEDPDVWFAGGADDDLRGKVEALLEARKAARAEKNWPEADRIRGELDAMGVVVMDSADGATWRLKESV